MVPKSPFYSLGFASGGWGGPDWPNQTSLRSCLRKRGRGEPGPSSFSQSLFAPGHPQSCTLPLTLNLPQCPWILGGGIGC